MDYTADEALLIERMKHRTPILVLGAGFSYGVKNQYNKPLPTAKELVGMLFSEVLSKSKKVDPTDLAYYKDHYTDLISICTACRSEELVKQRNEYLLRQFTGCKCPSTDYHHWLKLYPWRYIFTLNIDDLVETIYADQPSRNRPLVHRKDSSTLDRNASLELFKLHGCVTRPDLGFVFDKEEYESYTASPSWGMNVFANLFLTNDVVFLGTEFAEIDMRIMIQRNLNQVEINSAPQYFFISPEINNYELTRDIRKNKNLHHIQWDTKQFLSAIKTQITDVNDIRRKMRDYGMTFYDEMLRESEAEANRYLSKLYLGEYARPLDFFQDYDIRRPELENIADKLANNEHHLVVIYGDAYTGKTCAALRLGVDLMAKGYEFSVFPLNYATHATAYQERVHEYLSNLPSGTKIAILAENMSFYYGHVKRILEQCPPNISSLIFICTAPTRDHNSKKYLLDCYCNLTEIYLTERTADGRFSNNIYDKLSEKNHLNKLRSYGSNKKECVKYIREVNDLIEVLYIAQEGRQFVAYFTDLLGSKANDGNKEAFMILACLSALDVSEISIVLFSNIVKQCGISLNMNQFCNDYADVIRVQGERITIRCSRLLWSSCEKVITEAQLINWIKVAVQFLAKTLREREETLQNEVFQKLLKVKNLRVNINLDNDKILDLLLSVQSRCKHLSYYWVQRGIIHRDLTDFEEANNALSEAADIRQNTSYHIRHAQAKNYMEWGVWAIQHEPSHAAYYFSLGKDQIEHLIEIASSRFYAYSIHTYIDMTIKYYREQHAVIPEATMYTIIEILTQLSDRTVDRMIYDISVVFLKYCDSISYKSPELAELREKVSRIRRSDLPAQTSNAIDIDELIVDADNEVEVVQV